MTKADLNAPLIAPGYQYDIIRRRRGNLGLAVQFDLFNSSASLFAAAQVNTDNQVISAKKSLLAPIPVAGPAFRFYLTDSPRLFVEGNVYGMYFFGYGNFVSTADNLGVTLTNHLSSNAGYQLGSRLTVNADTKKDRLGLRLTQQGPVMGMEVSFYPLKLVLAPASTGLPEMSYGSVPGGFCVVSGCAAGGVSRWGGRG